MEERIVIVTKNDDGKIVRNEMTVAELINAWMHDLDIPTNDDEIVSCILGDTNLYPCTFGELMEILSGESIVS